MLKKSYSKKGTSCRVTFKIPAELAVDAEKAFLLGEFNEWDVEAHPMKQRKDGSFSTTVSLDAGQDYRFRYLLDEDRWINDTDADDLVPNRFGGQDCIVSCVAEA